MDDQQPGAVTSNEFIRQQQQHYSMNPPQHSVMNGHNGNYFSSADKEDSCNGSKTQSATTTESNTPESTVRIDGEMISRSSFIAKHSNNVTFLPNGELVTECKYRCHTQFENVQQFNVIFHFVHFIHSGGAKESNIVNDSLLLSTSMSNEHIVQTLADLSTVIKLGNCELPVKNFKYVFFTFLQNREK